MTSDNLIMRVERTLPAPPDVVFAAWTDPQWVASWMCPVPPTGADPVPVKANLDVRVGGRFTISMEHEGTTFTHRGEYVEVSPPNRLVSTWIIPLPTGDRVTRVTVELRAVQGEQTHMVILHERLPDPDMVDRHEVGWTAIVDRLAAHLQTRGR